MSALRLGTRASALAMAQSTLVQSLLLKLGVEAEIVQIRTTGDKLSEVSFNNIPTKGMFIKEIEEALLDGRVDFAVHSMKDLPTALAPGLQVGAVLEREDPRDCLVSRFGEQLMELPRGALVGTSALRRQAQIRAVKDKIRVQDIRGNLDTRLRKLMDGDYDSIVVAYAGVRRLGRADEVSEVLPFDVMLPAPAQGCIAIETRAGDAKALDSISKLDHAPSRRAAAAERSFLAALGGGCRVPIAAYAREESGGLTLDGLVISPDGKRKARGSKKGGLDDAERLGAELGAQLLKEGAREILKELDAPADAGAGA